MSETAAQPKRRRILKDRHIREFTARLEIDAYQYLLDLCASREQAMSRALTQVLREHKQAMSG